MKLLHVSEVLHYIEILYIYSKHRSPLVYAGCSNETDPAYGGRCVTENATIGKQDVLFRYGTRIIVKTEAQFYSDISKYWANKTPTIENIFGGPARISSRDIRGNSL